MPVLAIETSCDETSAAVVDQGRVLSNIVSSQVQLHAEYGGVVPELAAREHLRNLLPVARLALNEAGAAAGQLDAVAATRGPGLPLWRRRPSSSCPSPWTACTRRRTGAMPRAISVSPGSRSSIVTRPSVTSMPFPNCLSGEVETNCLWASLPACRSPVYLFLERSGAGPSIASAFPGAWHRAVVFALQTGIAPKLDAPIYKDGPRELVRQGRSL